MFLLSKFNLYIFQILCTTLHFFWCKHSVKTNSRGFNEKNPCGFTQIGCEVWFLYHSDSLHYITLFFGINIVLKKIQGILTKQMLVDLLKLSKCGFTQIECERV